MAHALFAFSLSFVHLFLARALAGFFGGNLAVAKACIADVTSPERRSKNMALIGLAFGLGFTLGPALGFLFIFAGQALGSSPPYGESFAALGAAIVCCANFAAAFFILRETRPGPPPAGAKKSRDKIPARIPAAIFSKQSLLFSRPPLWSVWKSLRAPRLGAALVMSFLLWLSLAQLEPTLILLVQDDFGWGKTGAYGGFAFIGLLIALSQGVLARRLIPKKGERRVNQWGLGFLFSGLFLIGGSAWLPSAGLLPPGFFSLAIGVTLFSIGYSLSDTSLSGMLSLLSGKQEQGKIFGVNQSLSSLARIAGPALGGWLYRDLSHSSPFFAAGAMGAGAFALALWKSRVLPDTGCRAGAAPAPLSQKDTLPPHAINKSQLKSLLEKKIPFCFFALEDLPPSGQPEIDRLAQAAPQKSAEKALAPFNGKGSPPAVYPALPKRPGFGADSKKGPPPGPRKRLLCLQGPGWPCVF